MLDHVAPGAPRALPEGQRPQSRPNLGRQRTRHGGTREFAVDEYWLTEAQLLRAIAKSRTPIAEAILDDMIETYMAVRLHYRAGRGPSLPEPNAVELARASRIFAAAVEENRDPRHSGADVRAAVRVLATFGKLGVDTEALEVLLPIVLDDVANCRINHGDPPSEYTLKDAIQVLCFVHAETLVPDHMQTVLRAKCAELELQLEEVRAIATRAANG